VSTPGFWDGLYTAAQDGWDLGGPAPALEDWLAAGRFTSSSSIECGGPEMAPALPQSADTRLQARVAVPGAGRAHDARLLARLGYRVTAFDFSDTAVAEARRLAAVDGVDVVVELRDVFTLGRDHAGAFDGVWEYTCFRAIDPARREEYAQVLHTILRPGGLLLACFFPLREGGDGPPFPVSRADIDRALAGRFTVVRAGAPGRSAERRRALEWLVEARRA
jgi:methyl halide transferase